jgi:hypothetical protein
MQKYHQHFPEIDNVYWTDYFLKEFLPKYKFYDDLKKSAYNYVSYNNIYQYPEIEKFSKELMKNYNFPAIEYFLIFSHRQSTQPVHIDGIRQYRHASLNLTLSGYQNTKMLFYKENKPGIQSNVSNANYFDIDDLTLVDEFHGTNNWVMINSGVPHQAVGINLNDTKITVCIRFIGNPKFEDLITNAKL